MSEYKATAYLRYSRSKDKSTESDSIANQRKLIDEFLKRHPEIELVSERVDDGFTGILFDRPDFQAMMQDVETGKVNCILTKDLSRFGREHIETGRYLRRILPSYGVRFIAINDNIDTLDEQTDNLTVSVKNLLNDEYCRDISRKTRSALKVKRADGCFVGACPVYGYKKSESNHNQLDIDEYPASVVRDIYRMKLDGMSAAAIAEHLNTRGILSPIEYKKDRGLPHPKGGYADKDGAKWSATTIIRMLKDETYTGTLIQGKSGTPNYKLKELEQRPQDEWHRVENAHKGIITPFTFDLVQRVMNLDTRTSPGGKKVYTFSGILVCGCCGNHMARKTVNYKGKSYHYYYCPTGKKNGCESAVMLKESDLMHCVLCSVKAQIANVASLETVLANLDADSIGRELAERLTAQLMENQRRLDKIHKLKSGLHENMIDGLLSKEEVRLLKGKYTEDAAAITATMVQLQSEIEDALSCKHERMAWIGHFKQFANLDIIDRKTVIHLIRSIKIIGKTEIEITFNYQDEYQNILDLTGRTTGGGLQQLEPMEAGETRKGVA